ncbi:MAG TPA: homoserine O-succinyltransferase [Steroidobacteraceae bacterium]|nr:homoserine O-succinyltransferase [Steroidobacteraceae bacterium]
MPLEIEAPAARGPSRVPDRSPAGRTPIAIGLVNNMPDAALHSTETQFRNLLSAAAGTQQVRLRFSSFPELPRAAEAREHIAGGYWPIEQLMASPLDALIVTGTEPRAARLSDEPYWERSVALLSFAETHTTASIWSCLAAHAAVLSLDGIERQRLAEKRCGVYAHSLLTGHALLAGVSAPLAMPHSRWNELSPEALRAAGYTLLSWSPESGADAFVRQKRTLMLFFQGHPEYEDTTLLKEYRRDVSRYLNAQQAHYPTLPHGYLTPEATAVLVRFRERAEARREAALLEEFPFATVAAALKNTWRPAAVAIYRNWLAWIAAARAPTRAAETVSLASYE